MGEKGEEEDLHSSIHAMLTRISSFQQLVPYREKYTIYLIIHKTLR